MRLIHRVPWAILAACAAAGVFPVISPVPSAVADDWNGFFAEVGCAPGKCAMHLGESGESGRRQQAPVQARTGKQPAREGAGRPAAAAPAVPVVPPDCSVMNLAGSCVARGWQGLPAAPGQATSGGPSAEAVAQQAVQELDLPAPVVRMSPDAGAAQVVRFPTWLWIDASGWRPVSKTVQVPGASVTATATPQRVVWSMGDGGSVTCAGPGTPYSARYPAGSPSPDCGYVYQRSSAGRPGEAFTVAATVVWDVVWQGAGKSGSVRGMEMTSRVPVRVSEVQSVVVAGSGRI